jgi:hypothetical protein
MLLIGPLLCAGVAFASCSTLSDLPVSARDALTVYWESLPSHPSVEHRIVRAWPGETGEDLDPPIEIWCVEAELSSADDPSIDGELLMWIVTRESRGARWSAALLASLSSMWPYEACADAPG